MYHGNGPDKGKKGKSLSKISRKKGKAAKHVSRASGAMIQGGKEIKSKGITVPKVPVAKYGSSPAERKRSSLASEGRSALGKVAAKKPAKKILKKAGVYKPLKKEGLIEKKDIKTTKGYGRVKKMK